MIVAFASRFAVAASLLCLGAMAHAQPTPAASAPDAARAQLPCEKGSFDVKGTVDALAGVKVPPQGLVVRILLQFDDPRAEPEVTVTFNSGDQAFADAVLAEAKKYRFDCVKEGDAPLRYVQEIQFVGADATKAVTGVIRPLVEKSPVARAAQCLVGANGRPSWAGSGWPSSGGPAIGAVVSRLEKDANSGLVIAQLTFRGPDVAPEATILFRRGSERLEGSVLDYVAGYHWSCMENGDPPVVAVQTFRYVGDSVPGPTPLTLQQFLSAVDKITEQKVRFDLTTMGCPFTVRLNYTQPFSPNTVEEIGGLDPNRREFVHWLHGVTVKPALNPDNKLIDRDFEVSVPCLVLDLL